MTYPRTHPRTTLEQAYYSILALNQADSIELGEKLKEHYKDRTWIRFVKTFKLEDKA